MSGVLYLSTRCQHSMELLRELYATQNRDYKIVDVDRVERWSLPQAVTGVPMALLLDGRTLVGKALFNAIRSRPVVAQGGLHGNAAPAPPPEPEAVGFDGFGAALDADHADRDPQSSLDQFFANVDTPQEDPPENKTVNLDALQQARMSELSDLGR